MFSKKNYIQLTFTFRSFVVRFADQFPILHEVELVAGVELSGAHDAGEALQVVDVVLGSAHDLRWRNPQIATGALRAETSAPTAAPQIQNRHCYIATTLLNTSVQ